MDRLRLKRRMRLLLAVGGILVALVYLGTMANRARLSWAAHRAEATSEDGKADAEANNADDAGRQADQAGRQGRMAEAEQWTRFMVSSRRNEALHRQKAREWLERW